MSVCLKVVSLRVCTSIDRKSPSPIAFESCQPVVSNLNLKHLESSITFPQPQASTDRNHYSIQVFCRICAFLLMWVSKVAPHCTSFVVLHLTYFLFLSPPLPLRLSRFQPSFCTPSQPPVCSSLTKQSLHVLICPIVQHTAILLCSW